ncbi:MAG: glycosyltransferase family 39 protein [Deltaproteobacteria bacterium]|nr:glycosyltransferase family 39 protein [Deltaproteobacteria bacterium]
MTRIVATLSAWSARLEDRRVQPILSAALVTLVWATLVFVLGAGGPRDYWFEDDPLLFAISKSAATPISFFVEHSLVQHALNPVEVVPMLFASFWVDTRIASSIDTLPLVAMAHSALSTLLAALLLQRLLARFVPIAAAAAAACLWLLLPSTQSTLEFASTRCYQEGLVFSLIALLFCHRYLERDRVADLAGALVAAAFAMWSKELFVATLPTLLGLLLLRARRYRAFFALVVLCFACASYRIWAVGWTLRYAMDPPRITDVFALARQIPRLSFASGIGYVAWALVLAGLAAIVVRRPERRGIVAIFLVTTLVAWLTLLPITHALLQHNTGVTVWSRSLFVVNTIFAAACGWLLGELRQRRAAFLGATFVFALGTYAALASIQAWNSLKQPLWAETLLVLQHPNAVFISDAEAHWYFEGLERLYRDRPFPVVIHKGMSRAEIAHIQVRPDVPWYRLEGGVMVSCDPSACLQ